MYQCGDNKKLTFCEAASIDIFSFVAFMCLSTPTLPFMTDFRLTRPGLSRRMCQYDLGRGRMGASVVSVGAAQPVPRPLRLRLPLCGGLDRCAHEWVLVDQRAPFDVC